MADDLNAPAWSHPVKLTDVSRAPVRLTLAADETERVAIARQLKLPEVERLEARATVTRWLDGLQVDADWRGRAFQTCGVTLEPFAGDFSGRFQVRAVPPDSDAAPVEGSEDEIDLSTPDPPDLLVNDTIDVAALVVEHLGLELDAYPRAPGVVFEPPEEDETASPFAVLAGLKSRE